MQMPDKSTGNGRHKLADRGFDLYETPPEAVRALLAAETIPLDVWEPAAGRGAISRVLMEAGHHVVSTELEKYPGADWGVLSGVDFLAQRHPPAGVQCILTNPPYQKAAPFVRHALTLVPDVIMLMRLAFLEGTTRSDIIDHHLQNVLVFRDRLPMMHRWEYEGPRSTSAMAFAWMRFAREKQGPTVMRRISWKTGVIHEAV